MSNIHRLRKSDKIFFVTGNLHSGVTHFSEPEFGIVLDVLHQSRQRLGFLLCGYVLMPDHFHALIWPPFPLTISRVLQDVKSVSSRKLNRLRKRRGALWQHQFWDRFVRHAKEFSERLEYMHYNPVRKGLVQKPEQWRWSSYNNFALDKSVVAASLIQIDCVQLPDDYRA